ncbi:uncharacterized protein LOC144747504 [Ciona intestinalis]
MELPTNVREAVERQNEFLYKHVMKLRGENMKRKFLQTKIRWSHGIIQGNDKLTKYLTGCPSYKMFEWVLQLVVKHGSGMLHDQLMVTLMKIKLDIDDNYLNLLFHNMNAQSVIPPWSNTLHINLAQLIQWPQNSKSKYVVDIIELRPNLHVVVVFTMNGTICFISEAIVRSSKLLFDECNFKDKLKENEKIIDVKHKLLHTLVDNDGVANLREVKLEDDSPIYTDAVAAIKPSIEKLNSFAVFNDMNFSYYKNMNEMLRIAAAIVNFH